MLNYRIKKKKNVAAPPPGPAGQPPAPPSAAHPPSDIFQVEYLQPEPAISGPAQQTSSSSAASVASRSAAGVKHQDRPAPQPTAADAPTPSRGRKNNDASALLVPAAEDKKSARNNDEDYSVLRGKAAEIAIKNAAATASAAVPPTDTSALPSAFAKMVATAHDKGGAVSSGAPQESISAFSASAKAKVASACEDPPDQDDPYNNVDFDDDRAIEDEEEQQALDALDEADALAPPPPAFVQGIGGMMVAPRPPGPAGTGAGKGPLPRDQQDSANMFACMYLVSGNAATALPRRPKVFSLEQKVKAGDWVKNSFLEASKKGPGAAKSSYLDDGEQAGPPTKKRRTAAKTGGRAKASTAAAVLGGAVGQQQAAKRQARPKAKTRAKAKAKNKTLLMDVLLSDEDDDMGIKQGARRDADHASATKDDEKPPAENYKRPEFYETVDPKSIHLPTDSTVDDIKNLVDDPEAGEETRPEPKAKMPKNTVNRNLIHELNQRVLQAKRIAARREETRKGRKKNDLGFSLNDAQFGSGLLKSSSAQPASSSSVTTSAPYAVPASSSSTVRTNSTTKESFATVAGAAAKSTKTPKNARGEKSRKKDGASARSSRNKKSGGKTSRVSPEERDILGLSSSSDESSGEYTSDSAVEDAKPQAKAKAAADSHPGAGKRVRQSSSKKNSGSSSCTSSSSDSDNEGSTSLVPTEVDSRPSSSKKRSSSRKKNKSSESKASAMAGTGARPGKHFSDKKALLSPIVESPDDKDNKAPTAVSSRPGPVVPPKIGGQPVTLRTDVLDNDNAAPAVAPPTATWQRFTSGSAASREAELAEAGSSTLLFSSVTSSSAAPFGAGAHEPSAAGFSRTEDTSLQEDLKIQQKIIEAAKNTNLDHEQNLAGATSANFNFATKLKPAAPRAKKPAARKKTTVPVVSAALNAHLDRLASQSQKPVKKQGAKNAVNGFTNYIPQSKGYERRMRAAPNRSVAMNKRLMKGRRGGKGMNFSANNNVGQMDGRALQSHYLSKRAQLAKENFAQNFFVDNPGWEVPLWSRGFGKERTVVNSPEEALEKLNFKSFRRGQREAIKSVVDDRLRTLLLLPTGMGKSLVYQICALLLRSEGLTLVVTPLVALMADQLRNLPVSIRGAAINSHQTPEQSRRIMNAVRNNEVDLLFVTPERLAMWALSSRDFPIALVCVDEAHCVSVWSHNFRPTYMRLNYFFGQLNIPRVLALTATATARAIDGIQGLLNIDIVLRQNLDCDIVREKVGGGKDVEKKVEVLAREGETEQKTEVSVMSIMKDQNKKVDKENESGGSAEQTGPQAAIKPESEEGTINTKTPATDGKSTVLSQSILRRNLTCTVSQVNEKEKGHDLVKMLQQDDRFRRGSVLVYVWRRKTVTALAKLLGGRGVQAVGYHSALSAEDRDRFQKEFTVNRIRVMVTTIAFGMGIDKPDIQGVIHYDMPKSLENFVQESGRCARDLTRRGHCHIYVNEEDFAFQRKYIHGSIGAHGSAVDKLLELIFNKKRRHAMLKTEDSDNDVESNACSSVVLNEKETARILGCETDEVHSLLANMERLSGDAFRLYSSFPAKVKLRFFGKTEDEKSPEQLMERDLFLAQLLPLCRVNAGVYSFDTLKAIKQLQPEKGSKSSFSVASTPGEFLTNLHVCAGLHRIAVDRDNYGYLIEVLREPSQQDLKTWCCSLKAHVRQVETVAAEQIDSCYCAFYRVAQMMSGSGSGNAKTEANTALAAAANNCTALLASDPALLLAAEGESKAKDAPDEDDDDNDNDTAGAAQEQLRIRKSTAFMSTLIDMYFYSPEGQDVVAKICGGKEKKLQILSDALGVAPGLMEKLADVDQQTEDDLWKTHPSYAKLRKDVAMHCRTPTIRAAMKKAKEPSLLITNVLLGRFCTMLGPDLEARWRWMKNPLWNTQADYPFGLVYLCVKEVNDELIAEDLAKILK
ncbi:unnamed protein product [Amoebophrya sp. A120]|nr:unnamed protein product [Amoebophrya sp. A120]|eukprot:GSA120T00003240001.1